MYNVVMGDRGRLVIPAELRAEAHLSEGTRLVLVATDVGIVVLDREQLKHRVRADLAGLDLVGELLAERRAAARVEDGG